MTRSLQRNARGVLLLAAVCAVIPAVYACNVPVFRYAMERWPPDPYQIVVYHKGPRGAAFELLEKGVRDPNGPANFSLKAVEVTAEQRGIDAFPWVEIYYPVQSQMRIPVWSGPLTSERAARILESPARSRLVRALLSGDVAVWILVKSGHEQKDKRALEALNTHLKRASETLRIPETGVDVNGNPVDVKDFKTYPVRFGLMEIARNDPQEELLVSALLKSEPDLAGYDEPMAFPVFGRGRALYALVGEGIQEKNIRETCESMLAWCSCEIKAQSPGTDLLIAADWSRPFGGRMVKGPELPLTGPGAFLTKSNPPAPQPATPAALCERVPPARSAPARTSQSDSAPVESRVMRNVLYAGGAAGLSILALSVLLSVKARKRTSGGSEKL